MRRSFRLGTILDFPIRVNLSFLLMLAVVFFMAGGLHGVTLVLLAAGSVLLHELGHAITARHLGVPIAGIELHFFGGAAQMAGMPRRPGDEIAIAAAGPAVSFTLAGAGWGLSMLLGYAGVHGAHAFALLGWVNLLIGAFNLLPAFPSDGGRILRALLARKRGLVRATDVAVKVGRFVCVALGVTGLAIGSLQMVLVAGVLWLMGTAERFSARMRGDHGAWRGEGREPPVEYIPPGGWSHHRGPIVTVWRL